MRRTIIVMAMAAVVYTGTDHVFAGEIALKTVSENAWEMYDEKGDPAGRLKRLESGAFIFYNKRGEYGGKIIKSGQWVPRIQEHRPRIDPQAAQLYLDILKAIGGVK